MSHRICSTAAYFDMIRDKSGALLWMACGLGATLSGADQRHAEALGEYSDLLGIGYQIRDDLMAYDGTRAGKPNVSDIRNSRPTLPVLLAHRDASPEHQHRIERILADTTSPIADRREAMTELVHEYGAVRSARETSHDYARLAAKALDPLPPSEHKNALIDLTVPGNLA
ncbi:geranylgeranyl pyrophosphate synthase [Saccharopolyspora lacisalsi]|uniref:Geranylgeranyl pyrophosphate synthase n=2 Tax=Halosaccharopolyspora lacisalsi TaxID=1000566 RepID=A0A839DZC1_9PSEU|nr:geranylgeranyl pyrophosphate synthase [Halosaccharopolyspora lacisalsi]